LRQGLAQLFKNAAAHLGFGGRTFFQKGHAPAETFSSTNTHDLPVTTNNENGFQLPVGSRIAQAATIGSRPSLKVFGGVGSGEGLFFKKAPPPETHFHTKNINEGFRYRSSRALVTDLGRIDRVHQSGWRVSRQ
jgi:hypothetical protein